MVSPGAIAERTARRPGRGIALSVTLAVVFTWLGLAVAYYTPYPVSFFITGFAFVGYVATRTAQSLRAIRANRRATPEALGALVRAG
jgi:zinc/manganese transport system permease protein